MSPSDKNFGNNSNAPNATTPTLVNAAAHSDPNVIHRFDEYGRELLFPKEQWRTQVLPDAIRAQWENPAQLYDVIAAALNEGLIADVLGAAERLHSIDPVPARGACAHGVVLMKNMHVDAAERVFLEYLQQYGDEAAILGNLATIYANRKDTQKAEETLWRALELDPNLEYGLNWYEALQHALWRKGASQRIEESGPVAWQLARTNTARSGCASIPGPRTGSDLLQRGVVWLGKKRAGGFPCAYELRPWESWTRYGITRAYWTVLPD